MSAYDCNQPMCNICTGTSPTFPCVGVPGAADPSQTGQTVTPPPTSDIWKYGNKTYIPLLRAMDTDSNKQCTTSAGLGLYDIAGTCVPGSFGANNGNLTQKNQLIVNWNTFQNLVNKPDGVTSFPLQALHKVWGDKNGQYNKGVNSRNVYVSPTMENVQCYVGPTDKFTLKQQVMYLEAHGDKYTGLIPGITRKGAQNVTCFNSSNQTFYTGNGKKCNTGDTVLPQCPEWSELDSSFPGYNQRVGGVACTREQYGPGVYNLLCYVPKTEDTSNGGRGYVFAIWPFHYEEIYKGQQKVDDTQVPCFSECDGMTPVDAACPTKSGCYPSGSSGTPVKDDYFSAINHEIDIEIPSNSPQMDWKTQLTWDTMNCNTWNSDIDYYGVDTGAYYSQVMVKNPAGSFISTEPESSDNKDYHWYTLDWYVDPVDYTKNYVAFYFDDPFDPSGTVQVGSATAMLPKQPQGKPVFITQRFVPTRSGRLNFGPWMAWWGYGANAGLTPQFDTAKVRVAQLSITPYSSLWDGNGKYLLNDFPQSYDQAGAVCDFRDLQAPSPGPTPPGPTPPDPNNSTTTTNKGLPLWVIIVIILGVIVLGLIIWAIVDAVKRKKRLV